MLICGTGNCLDSHTAHGTYAERVALMPYTQSAEGASLSYKMKIPQKVDTVNVYVVVKSTLPFLRREGHRYTVGFEGGEEQTVCFNAELNEHPVMYIAYCIPQWPVGW